MYLMQTVSAVPRPRATVHMESRSPYAQSASIDIQNCIKHLTEDDQCNYKNSYEGKIRENGIKPSYREELLNEYNKQRVVNNNPVEAVNRIDYDDDEKDRKKEKKWTLGGFFRRKCRKDADDSSEESGDGRKGFLSRRKSKRDRRKPRAKTNGFDVIIPQQKEQPLNGLGKTVDDLWGNGDVKNAGNGPVRYIYRHQPNGVPEKPKDTLQVPKQTRRDSNLSRNSSGGSGSLEGRKGRKEVLARAEAKRDRMRDESSSDENESYHSSSSLNRLTADGRRVRPRHGKRLSRDEESLLQNGDFRVVKSDFEGHRLPHNRWVPRGYPDSSDHENVKFSLINHSATPSPARSPRARQKQLTPSMSPPNSYPVNTFPPGVHYPQGRSVPNYNGYPSPKYIHTKDPQVNVSQPVINVNYRKNRNSEYIQPSRRSTSEHSTNRRTLMDYEQFLSSCGSNREKSLSYDHDIHRASYFENDPSDVVTVQYPLAKTNGVQFGDGRSQPLRDPRRIPGVYYDLPQRTPKPYDNDVESLSMGSATNSLPVQHPNYQLVQRSASGNSFCNVYENSKDAAYNQIRSNSYQHIPSYVSQQSSSRANPDRLKACVQNGVKYPHYRTMTESVTATPAIVHSDAKDKVQKSESLPKPQLNSSVPNLRYYADQNPRSRNPIHITCNATPSPTLEQPCEPQAAKSQQNSVKDAITNASDFWKLKDQESMMNMHMRKSATNSSSKPPITQGSARAERSRSGSPKPKEATKKMDAKLVKEDAKVSKPAEQKMKAEPQVKHKADTNLDDALNELESIYNSLRLGDEDLAAGAERRDLPTYKSSPQKISKNDPIIKGRTYDVYPTHEHQRAVPQRRSGVPDKVNDDMAYRRMNAKERSENKKYPPLSYLRASPALSPVMGDNPNNFKETPHEPDVTYDDVVFRNIRHANSTLKIQDPQPPFGIPLGPITPAANSDYLHATPKDRFRPTFTSSKVPDVVKDDLAFRNLRKDNMTANLPVVENTDTNKNYLLQKKRAVRSLSANLYNLIQRESACHQIEKNNNILEKDCEKTQSLTDLSEKEEKQALEKRLKQLKDEKNAKRAEFFELAKEQRKKRNSKSKLSWTELAHLNGDFENVPQVDTSTETLTEENGGVQQRLRVNFTAETPEQKTYRSPVVELSKYPAAAPSSTLYSNPFREATPGSPLDEAQLEDLLSALEKEAKSASEDLGRQLVELELSEDKRRSASLSSEKVEEKYSSLERKRDRRSRNNSVGEKEQQPEEEKPVDMLEKLCNTIQSEIEEPKKTEVEEDVGKLTNEIIQITEELIRRETKERKRSNGFEAVSDLSEILHEMEEQQQQQPKPKDTFQEVYEYNIGLPEGEASAAEEAPKEEDNEIEREFEKLHAAVDADDAVVSELLADVTGGSSADREECRSLRPFPKEVSSRSFGMSCGDGSSPGSSNGEGEAIKLSLDNNNVWLACSYALALALQFQELDCLTALGIILAIISIVAILIL
ncbi:UNVERIFIED_CONTAM: hypothetical protein PYX00_008177 [Menopon gallinae]|uniref:Uncharacterized protein n=1 Tax=Menopon gallinae TaxID=328185 RepID=A0AAW2HMW2_9NEOP